MEPIAIQHIELRMTRGGQERAYIVGTRVRVHDVYVLSEVHDKSPDAIVAAFPYLSLGQVHAALAYCFDNRDQIAQQLRDDERFVEAMKRSSGPGPLSRKLGTTNGGTDSVSS